MNMSNYTESCNVAKDDGYRIVRVKDWVTCYGLLLDLYFHGLDFLCF